MASAGSSATATSETSCNTFWNYGAGQCYDCHASDAKGDTDYGAPDLTADVWSYGGDPGALYKSIYYGRHGVMPAWYGKLSLEQIRALAVYVHAAAH
jgi:cytochrome c oxidase cbb3-type subunit 3